MALLQYIVEGEGEFSSFAPQLLSATNSAAGVIDVVFSGAMILDDVFRRIQNFVITPVGNGSRVKVLEVQTDDEVPNAATVLFEGGGSHYTLTVTGVINLAGTPIDADANSVVFELGLPGGDAEPITRLFDTVFGPLGIIQRPVTRRTVDGLVINRAIDLGVNKQLKQRLDALGASIPLRSGKDGGRRR